MLALELGPRPGEATALEWKHIDFDEKSIRIKKQFQTVDGNLHLASYAKTDAGDRVIPMPEHLADVLQQHRKRQLEQMGKNAEWAAGAIPTSPRALFTRSCSRHPDSRGGRSLHQGIRSSGGGI